MFSIDIGSGSSWKEVIHRLILRWFGIYFKKDSISKESLDWLAYLSSASDLLGRDDYLLYFSAFHSYLFYMLARHPFYGSTQ